MESRVKKLIVGVVLSGLIVGGLIVYLMWHSDHVWEKAVARVEPAVVSIVAAKQVDGLQRLFFGGATSSEGPTTIGGGTGFFVSRDGVVVTANHILTKGETYTVIIQSGEKYQASVVAQFPEDDVAVLDIEGDNYPTVRFASIDKVKPGYAVMAIGNSLGYYQDSVLAGVVSYLNRTIEKDGRVFEKMLQLHLPISVGDSGAPVFDRSGRVMGMLVAFDNQASAISFALPSEIIQKDLFSLSQ